MKTSSSLMLVSAISILSTTSLHAAVIGVAATGDQTGGLGSTYAYGAGDNTTESSGLSGHVFSYQAEASFTPGALTPELRAQVSSSDISKYGDPFVGADAYGFQTYRNISGNTQNYTINLNLHGIIKNAPSSYINTDLRIYSGTDAIPYADFTSCASGEPADYMSGFRAYTCGTLLDRGFNDGLINYNTIEMTEDGELTITDTASFNVAAGQTFSIYAELETLTVGGFANAYGTLKMDFVDTTYLEPLGQVSPIPVPAAVWLFGSGLLGLFGLARRK